MPVCNKRVLESLCKAGAFDSLGYTRRGLVAVHEEAADQYIDLKRNEAIGQDSLFGGLDDDTFAADHRPGAEPGGVGQAAAARATSATCSASTSPTIRSTGSSTSWPGAAT